MKRTEKVATKIDTKTTEEVFFEALKNADEDDLKVLLAAMFLEGREGEIDTARICEALGIGDAEFNASFKYWHGAGLMSVKKSAKKEGAEKKEIKIDSAHKDGKLQSSDEMPSYSTEELAVLMKRRKITSEFIGEAARVYGKIFNQHEVGIIVRMIDYIGFSEESVLMLLSHFAKQEQRKTLRYIEKTALELYDEGICEPKALSARLEAIEASRMLEGKIKTMFGMNGRSLTTKEKKFISSWVDKGFDIEMIRLAYEITVDKTHEPAPAYANAILERWHADGIDTPEKVKAAQEKKNAESAGDVPKSFDNDDFFEAALKRTYGDKK